MKKANVVKVITLILLLILTLIIGKEYVKTSFGADNNVNGILEGAINKYVNYSLSNGEKGTIVEYALRTGMEYENEEEFNAIKLSELNINVNQIDGKYPSEVKVIEKSSKVTNGKTEEIEEDYSYDASNGNLVIRTSNENENGEAIYNEKPSESDRDEYIIIAKYDTYTEEKEERELICDVEYKAVLFDEEREIISEGTLGSKVTENVGELTTVSTTREDIYNGHIKSNVINGTTYETEYKEENEIEISNKEAQERLKIEEKNTFEKEGDVYYKSTKILKDGFVDVLGENGKVEIIDQNGNIVSTIDNNSFGENGEVVVEYGEDVNSITIETSKIEKEGIIKVENVKKIKSDVLNVEDRDIVRNLSVVGTFEKEVEIEVESSNEERINVGATLNIDLNLNNNEEENNGVNVNNTEEPEKTTQTVEEESYRNDEEETIEVKNSTTNVEVSLDNTNWTNEKQNEVTFDIYLNSSNVANNLFDSPSIRIKLPSDIEKVILGNSSIVYSNGLNMEEPYVEQGEDGSSYIVVNLSGKQTVYTESDLDLKTNIKIPVSIILNKDIESRKDKLTVIYTNNYTVDGSTEQGAKQGEINITNFEGNKTENNNDTSDGNSIIDKVTEVVEDKAKEEAIVGAPSQDEIDGLEIKVTPVKGDTELKDGDTVYEGEFIKYNVEITNTTSNPIENVRVIGTIPEGTVYGELISRFDTLEDRDYQYSFDEDLTEKEIEIGTIKAGETINSYYEVEAKDLADDENEKDISTNIKTYIDDTVINSVDFDNKIGQGDVKAFLWSTPDGVAGEWAYGINLYNPTGEEVEIKIELPEIFTVNQEDVDNFRVYSGAYTSEYVTSINNEDITIVENPITDYTCDFNERDVTINAKQSGTYKIGVLRGNESKLKEEYPDGNVELKTIATINKNGVIYKSNENRIKYSFDSVVVKMTSDTEGEEVRYNDEIIYNISISCTGISDIVTETSGVYVNIRDFLPENVKPESITYEYFEKITEKPSDDLAEIDVGFSEKKTKTETIFEREDVDGNKLPDVDLYTWIPYQETINIQVKTRAGFVYEKTTVENSVTVQNPQLDGPEDDETTDEPVEIETEYIATKESNEVIHIVLPYDYDEENPDDPDEPTDPSDPSDPSDPDDPNNPGEPDDPSDPNAKYSISGIAWNDANGDGERQDDEGLIDGVSVLLVDLSDSNNVKAQASTSNGNYSFGDLEQGNYIVVFRYDTSTYMLSEYKASGVAESVNSDAMQQTITLDGKREAVGLTDQITLNENASNIDIGLTEKGGYDLKLDKYITDVTVTTSAGDKQYSYDNTKLGRVEIRSKEINGAKVEIKYRIVVTNEGSSAATVNEIYDNVPNGLEFSTTKNSNWIEDGGKLVNTSLSNQTINPGESKEVTLILTKTMTGEDAGTFKNTAEIGSAEGSVIGTEDIDSTPGNGNTSEDDYSEAEIIIGVGTGVGVYISIGVIIAIIAILVFLGIKFKFKIKKITKIGLSIFVVGIIGISMSNETLAVSFHYISYVNKLFSASGAPTSTAYCYNHGAVAAGWNTDIDGQNAHCTDSESAYARVSGYYSSSYTYGAKEYTSPLANIDRIDKGDRIPARKVNGKYVLGPFVSKTNTTEPYTITVYSKSGGTLGYSICDENGNNVGSVRGNGNENSEVTFYISLSASAFERGVSRVTARAKKMTNYRQYYWHYVQVRYYYTGGICMNGTGSGHQGTYTPRYIEDDGYIYDEEWTYDEIEWTTFEAIIELLKVDLDEHEKQDDYEVYLDIEGTFQRPDGTIEHFKTTNGRYTWDRLVPGRYIITETINNNYGYEQNVQMVIDVTAEGGKLCIVYMTNWKDTGNLKVIKKDIDSGKPMGGVGFKLRGDEGYVIGIDSGGSPIKVATGKVQLYNMEYTSDKSQATTFKTDDNGVLEVYNIRTGTYTVEEVSVNPDDYGYELDPEYVFCEGQQGVMEGTVVVVRQKSYYTTGRPGESYPGRYVNVPGQGNNQNANTGVFNGIHFQNRRKWVKISGKVFEKMLDGKGTVIQGGYSYVPGTDELVANVSVNLLDSSGNIVEFRTEQTLDVPGDYTPDPSYRGASVTSVDTDSNGEYTIVDVLIDKLDQYYIQFTYNGMSYESIPLLDMDILSESYNGTRAIETDPVRSAFNNKFAVITHSNSTGPVGESRSDVNGGKTSDLSYKEGEHTSELDYGSDTFGHDKQIYPINYTYEQYLIHANTKDAFQEKGYSGYLEDMRNREDIRLNEETVIDGFDLGIKEREQPDMALVEDIEKVNVSINGFTHTYNYNQRFQVQEPAGFDVGVKFGDEYGMQEYTQPIYSSDVVYNENHPGGLVIEVRYKVALRNESTNLDTRINEITNYHDEGYEFVRAEYEGGGEISGCNSQGGSTTIPVMQELEPMQTSYVYITYRVTDEKIKTLVNVDNTTLESVTEITSYSTFDTDGSVYAGVDKDSRPGSAEPGVIETYEDDTDSAPGLLLQVKEGRVISGTVWEDEPIQKLLNGSELQTIHFPDGDRTVKERIGDGLYNTDPNVVNNVTVELIEVAKDANLSESETNLSNEITEDGGPGIESTVAKIYIRGTGEKGGEKEARVTTGENGTNGYYEFNGVIPGNYMLRFTYKGDSVIIPLNGTEGEGEEIEDLDKYKSTIYRGGDKNGVNSNDDDLWYREETSDNNGAQRLSDARDETAKRTDGTIVDVIEERGQLKETYYYGNSNNEVTQSESLTEIRARSRGFSIKVDYDENRNNESTYAEQEKGLKCEFDNLDFGIIRRPIQTMDVYKEISYVKVKLANGQTVIEGDPRHDTIEHLRFLPDVSSDRPETSGEISIELDSEILQGATLEITYDIIADNRDSEIDYNTDDYYIYGIHSDNLDDLIGPQILRLTDYLSNDLAYDPETVINNDGATNEDYGWTNIRNVTDQTINYNDREGTFPGLNGYDENDPYWSKDAYDEIQGFNQVLATDYFKDMKFEEKIAKLQVSRILSNTADDLTFYNDIEVNILKGRRTSKTGEDDELSIPGDYVPTDIGRISGGDDDYRLVTVTEPTGENQNYVIYVILGVSTLIILTAGIIFIKKKVL